VRGARELLLPSQTLCLSEAALDGAVRVVFFV